MIAMKLEEFDYVSDHTYTKPNKNMATRKSKVVQKQTVFEYVNIMKAITPHLILGHIGGPEVEIEYKLERLGDSAQFQILRRSVPHQKALEILSKEKNKIIQRVPTDNGKPGPRRFKVGSYYVQRSTPGKTTAAHEESLSIGVFPDAFLKHVVDWDFKVIKGRPKPKTEL